MIIALKKFIILCIEIKKRGKSLVKCYFLSKPNVNDRRQGARKINELNRLTYEKRLEELNICNLTK